MPFQLESDLLEPVSTWLQAAGFDVFDEVPILRHRADVVGLRGDGVTAIEMKLSKWDQALRQAIAYQLAADWAWVAMPLSSCGCDPEPGVWVPAEMVVSARRSAPRRLRTIRWREPGEGFGRDNLISPV